MSDKTIQTAGEISGGVIAAAATAINGDFMATTVFIVTISSIFGGILGFLTTRLMNWIFERFDETKRRGNARRPNK